MSFSDRPVDELIKIARAGAALTIHGPSFSIEDLVRIARTSKGSGALLTVEAVAHWPADDLIKLGRAGRGFIRLEE